MKISIEERKKETEWKRNQGKVCSSENKEKGKFKEIKLKRSWINFVKLLVRVSKKVIGCLWHWRKLDYDSMEMKQE